MKPLLVIVAVALLFVAWPALRDRAVMEARAERLSWRQSEILVMRERTHACTDKLGRHRFRVQERIIRGGPAYRKWVLDLWRGRARLYCKALADAADPLVAIRLVFGPHAAGAIHVARCESDYYPRDGVPDTVARNGQYRGIFQMGRQERLRYGHGETALEQARAAYAYFVASGKDWSPWDPRCRP